MHRSRRRRFISPACPSFRAHGAKLVMPNLDKFLLGLKKAGVDFVAADIEITVNSKCSSQSPRLAWLRLPLFRRRPANAIRLSS